jgi:membrane glycosyltransferase
MLSGVMGYVSSPLWLLFMMMSTIHVFSQVTAAGGAGHLRPEDYTSWFGYEVEVPEALTLFVFTMLLLFLPKIVSVVVTFNDKVAAARFGGRRRLVTSAIVETVLSTLLAPINMAFHSKFVLTTLLGQGVSWVTQRRSAEADGTDWREAIITHGGHTLFGLVWGVSSFIISPGFFWWLSPVIAGLVLSIPLSILLSKTVLGRAMRSLGVFLTPEEVAPAYELKRLDQNLAECYRHLLPFGPLRADYGLLQAVLDPYVNALHVALLRQKRQTEESREWFTQLRDRLLHDGPDKLTIKEKMSLLMDAESMIALHRQLWNTPADSLAEWWRLAMRQYNVLTTAPTTALYR